MSDELQDGESSSGQLASSFAQDQRTKPVNNRRNRPTWAMDELQLMRKCIGKRHMVRFTVAQFYWRENKTAQEIADILGMTLGAVEKTIQRLART
jgi:DNA-directed RNA polymerase specialized sigma24 family protein